MWAFLFAPIASVVALNLRNHQSPSAWGQQNANVARVRTAISTANAAIPLPDALMRNVFGAGESVLEKLKSELPIQEAQKAGEKKIKQNQNAKHKIAEQQEALDNYVSTAASSIVNSMCSDSYDLGQYDLGQYAGPCARLCEETEGCVHFISCAAGSSAQHCCRLSSKCTQYTQSSAKWDGYMRKGGKPKVEKGMKKKGKKNHVNEGLAAVNVSEDLLSNAAVTAIATEEMPAAVSEEVGEYLTKESVPVGSESSGNVSAPEELSASEAEEDTLSAIITSDPAVNLSAISSGGPEESLSAMIAQDPATVAEADAFEGTLAAEAAAEAVATLNTDKVVAPSGPAVTAMGALEYDPVNGAVPKADMNSTVENSTEEAKPPVVDIPVENSTEEAAATAPAVEPALPAASDPTASSANDDVLPALVAASLDALQAFEFEAGAMCEDSEYVLEVSDETDRWACAEKCQSYGEKCVHFAICKSGSGLEDCCRMSGSCTTYTKKDSQFDGYMKKNAP